MMRTKMKQRFISIHSWVGALSCLFILATAITGMAIAFSTQLLNLETDAFPKVQQRSKNAPVNVDSLRHQAQQTLGETFIPMGFLGADAEIATHVEMIYGLSDQPQNNGETQIVTFNPTDNEVIGTFYLDRTLTHDLIEFHYNLLLGNTGAVWVALIAVLLALLALVGLYLWWPSKKFAGKKMRTLRLRKNLKQASFSLHSFFGFWSAVIIMVWALTGVYWSKPEWGPEFIKPSTTALLPNQVNQMEKADCGEDVSINQAIDMALTSFPGTGVLEVEFATPWQPYHSIYLSTDSDLNKKDGDARFWASSSCQNLTFKATNQGLEKIGAINASIHSGELFGGLRVLAILIVGNILILLSITGLILWYKRLKSNN